jgi:hypothetical protein
MLAIQKTPYRVNTAQLSLKSHYMVGWVEERNPTLSRISLGFAIAQPNLHFLNRQVLFTECGNGILA